MLLFRTWHSSEQVALEGELHLLQMIGIGSLVAGMVIYQLGKMKEIDAFFHLGRALIAASVLFNISPILQGESSTKTLMVAFLFGLTGIILSSVIFFQIRRDEEEEEEY
jgi:hypothetical protein